jgi:hypothetical protein
MKILKNLWHRVTHKLHHFKWSHFKNILKEHGLAFLIIFIVWEIVEDVLFPLLFIWLGNNVNPWFLTGAPISWLLCLHPIAVPVMWAIWVKISRRKNESKDIEDQVCGPTCP